jgi:hypothetical protein
VPVHNAPRDGQALGLCWRAQQRVALKVVAAESGSSDRGADGEHLGRRQTPVSISSASAALHPGMMRRRLWRQASFFLSASAGKLRGQHAGCHLIRRFDRA